MFPVILPGVVYKQFVLMFTGCTISSQREIFILIGAGLIVSTVGAVVLHLFLVVVVVVAASFASRNRRNMKYEQDEVSIPVTYMLTSFVFHISVFIPHDFSVQSLLLKCVSFSYRKYVHVDISSEIAKENLHYNVAGHIAY